MGRGREGGGINDYTVALTLGNRYLEEENKHDDTAGLGRSHRYLKEENKLGVIKTLWTEPQVFGRD